MDSGLIYILYKVYSLKLVVDNYNIPSFEESIVLHKTNYDQTIKDLSNERVVLVVFLGILDVFSVAKFYIHLAN